MQYGFIGAGAIAGAIIRGMAAKKAARPEELCVFDVDEQKVAALGAELGLTVYDSAEELVHGCDVVVLAVKPHIVAQALAQSSEALKAKRPLLISVAAGKSLAFLRDALGFDAPIARVMPNTNAAVGESMSILCYNDYVTEPQRALVKRCFDAVGQTYEADESKMPALAALCGCSPAFTYLYVDALARAAHKAGVDKKTALGLAAQAVLGSAKMVLASEEHPAVLADRVCSPGGSTIEGVCELERRGFAAAVVAAADAAMQKDMKL